MNALTGHRFKDQGGYPICMHGRCLCAYTGLWKCAYLGKAPFREGQLPLGSQYCGEWM